MQLIDTHVHINFDVFARDLEAIQHRWREAGVIRLVHSCVEPQEFKHIQTLANRFPELSFAVGLHPLDAHKWTPTTAAEIATLAASDSRVVAIGELGLDFYKAENRELQETVCREQIAIARRLNKPVIVHCRDAAAALRELLQDVGSTDDSLPPLRGVMHCWGGSTEETQWFLDLGFYISFSGIVTFKNAKSVQESAAMVPRDRLLVETDCPFLAPQPVRGKRNEPAYVLHVAQKLAEIRSTSLETLAAQTTENACKLFGLG
ncbi:TatD family hydrolase [Lusitaniella coriacea]|uniref:TatD family hydrolase n=1 Tax=Lusitaniella coriacea TaxID=1983105 RepID=UPI003CF21B2E